FLSGAPVLARRGHTNRDRRGSRSHLRGGSSGGIPEILVDCTGFGPGVVLIGRLSTRASWASSDCGDHVHGAADSFHASPRAHRRGGTSSRTPRVGREVQ